MIINDASSKKLYLNYIHELLKSEFSIERSRPNDQFLHNLIMYINRFLYPERDKYDIIYAS